VPLQDSDLKGTFDMEALQQRLLGLLLATGTHPHLHHHPDRERCVSLGGDSGDLGIAREPGLAPDDEDRNRRLENESGTRAEPDPAGEGPDQAQNHGSDHHPPGDSNGLFLWAWGIGGTHDV